MIEPKDTVRVKIRKHADQNGGHHHIILDRLGDQYISVGLTTKKKKGENSPNYPLDYDPLQQGKKSYMRRQGTVDFIRRYSAKEKAGIMSKKDYGKALLYGEKAKTKYIDQKKKK